MPPHPRFTEYLKKFRVELHQLTLNAIVQISKFIWAVSSCGGDPSAEVFAKRYELHHQKRKVVVDGRQMNGQFGCLSFHPNRFCEDPVKLTPAIKNKWSDGWTRNWFYCNVSMIPSRHGGKGTHLLQSYMNPLNFVAQAPRDCAKDDPNDAAFVVAAKTIGGRDVVEEYTTCDIYPLAQDWELGAAPMALTPKSKVEAPLPKFNLQRLSKKSDAIFVRLVAERAEKLLGKYT